MIKILRVGDPHVTVRNLEDSRKLMDFILKVANEHNVERIEFMGDLFHTHAVIRMEVLDFWIRTFSKIALEGLPILALVGNHDQPGSKEKEQEMNALKVFKSGDVVVIDRPQTIGNIAYIPHMHNHEEFVKLAHALYGKGATKCLVAHQNFIEDLFGDKIESELVPQEQIISGHIHTSQQVGKCFNVGTPKWDTMIDANQDKGIWLFTHNDDGSVSEKTFISTENIVTPIKKYVINEGDELPEIDLTQRNYIELLGKTAWITKIKKKYKGKAQIKARPIDRKVNMASRGQATSLLDYLQKGFEPIQGVNKEDLDSYLKEVHNVQRQSK